MSAVQGLRRVMRVVREVRRRSVREQMDRLVVDRLLILFQGEHVVRPLVHHFARDIGLAPHRIDGDDASLQEQQIEQRGDGRDLIGLLRHCALTEHEAVRARPGTDHVDRRLARTAIM
jgi:hypothetical protein